MKVQVTEAFSVALVHPGGGVFEFSPGEARLLGIALQRSALQAEIAMEDYIATTRERGWVPPVAGGEVVL